MRVLFATLHNGYYRNLDSVVDELARRGHEVHLGAERDDSSFGGQPIVDRLPAAHSNVTGGRTAVRDQSRFSPRQNPVRHRLLRYLEPAYAPSSGLSLRARERTPTGMLRLSPSLDWRPVRRLVSRALDAVDRALPASSEIERYLDVQRPDLIVITPIVGLVACSQLDLLRSALRRGIATAVMTWSWDHLSSKAIIRDVPDALFVWNEVQKREAMHLHRVPEVRIVVTGAQCYDRWFSRLPTRSRTEFVRLRACGISRAPTGECAGGAADEHAAAAAPLHSGFRAAERAGHLRNSHRRRCPGTTHRRAADRPHRCALGVRPFRIAPAAAARAQPALAPPHSRRTGD